MTLRARGTLNTKKMTGSQGTSPSCNKETVGIKVTLTFQAYLVITTILGNKRLQKWTRGAFAIVNSGGHISYWAPLFKSEGPAQVAVIVLTFLMNVLGAMVPFGEWKDIVLAYDNMCHLGMLQFSKP